MLSWLTQAIAGRSAYNGEQLGRLQDPLGFWQYLGAAAFWNRTLQNWQSEFLAVALDGRALPHAPGVPGVQAGWRSPRVDRPLGLTPANPTSVLKSTLCVPITL